MEHSQHQRPRSPASETTRYARILPLALLGLIIAPRAALAQELSEAAVIELARTQSPARMQAQASADLANARIDAAGARLGNPSLDWSREALPTNRGGSEDTLAIRLAIEPVAPGIARAHAASEGAWAKAQAAALHTQAVLETLLVYYELSITRQRVRLHEQALSHLEEAARVLASKEAAGSASGYESNRLALATEVLRSDLRQAQGSAEAAQSRLAILLSMDAASVKVPDSQELLSASERDALLARGSGGLSMVAHAQDSERFLLEAIDRNRWAWLPSLELSAGMTLHRDNERSYGYIAGLSLDIPIFDRGQHRAKVLRAEHALSLARTKAVQQELDQVLHTNLLRYRQARLELERFDSQTSAPVQALLAAAQSGYREGERSIVELLDAQRVQIEVAERRLVLLDLAKRAEAHLRAAAGDFQ